MTRDEMLNLAAELFEGVRDTLDRKSQDYAPGDDALHEFKTTAAALELTPEQVWSVHFNKHVRAVLRYCKDGELDSESIGSRIGDIIAYAVLLAAIHYERTTK